jgi:quercetin dioxygenase-like cupin family protein
MSAYLDQSGEPSDEPGRFVHFADLQPLRLIDGMDFRPVTTDTVMTNHATIAPNTELATHHHAEQQIAIMVAGELTFTVGAETRTLRPGDCAVIPAHVPHGGVAGPEGATVIDVFSPPRAGIVEAMA